MFFLYFVSNQAQKAKEKEENEELIDQLDKGFASLVQSEALVSLTQPNKMRALNSLVNTGISNGGEKKEKPTSAPNKVSLQQVNFFCTTSGCKKNKKLCSLCFAFFFFKCFLQLVDAMSFFGFKLDLVMPFEDPSIRFWKF